MSEVRTVWHDMQIRRNEAVSRRRRGMLLAVLALGAMCAAEALFLAYFAGPDTVNLMAAAEGVPVTTGE